MRLVSLILIILIATVALAQQNFVVDTVQTSAGNLEITFIGHGTLMFKFDDKIIHIDPVGRYADYSRLPKADLILVTHEHGDHLDLNALSLIKTETTTLFLSEKCYQQVKEGIVLKNGDVKIFDGIKVEAVPAYNIIHKRKDVTPFHPRGEGNGYVISFGNERIYVAGDTENVPEMKALKDIAIAFLPMNLPYTMTPEMVADAAKAFKPKILYPYHYGETDPNKLVELLKDSKLIEVRIRPMK